jgi:hypothetical protein
MIVKWMKRAVLCAVIGAFLYPELVGAIGARAAAAEAPVKEVVATHIGGF